MFHRLNNAASLGNTGNPKSKIQNPHKLELVSLEIQNPLEIGVTVIVFSTRHL